MSASHNLPPVSVIIPTYNRSRLLQLAVESVLRQTYSAIEIVVVDDGSKDDTETVMRKYAGRVNYIKQANQGVSAARNAGFRAASGQCISFLDDDDLLMPTKIERQMQMFEARPEVGLVHCRYYYVDEDANPLDKVGLLPEREVLKKLVCGCFLWSGAPLIRRQCLDQVGVFDEHTWSACEEWDLWLRIAQAGYPFACVQELLGAYRMVSDSRMIGDLARLEHGMNATVDRVFADTHLPAEVVAIKEQAYSSNQFEISCRYYAVGRWEEAQKCLKQSLTLCPSLLEPPRQLVQLFYYGALDVRTIDPVKFVKDVFDHLPDCAEGFRPYRSQLLSKVHAGLTLRYYGLGYIDKAQQQLTEALTLHPQWLEEPDDLVRLIRDTALGPHIDDAVDFLARVFNHLPPCAERLSLYHSHLLSQAHIGLALRSYGSGDMTEAKRQLAEALTLNPRLLEQKEDFKRLLCNHAMNLPHNMPVFFVKTVFRNLPEGAQPLARLQSQVLGEVSIACAFEDYTAGRRRSAARRVLTELFRRPSWIRNRGVVSIFLKSAPSLLTSPRSPSELG